MQLKQFQESFRDFILDREPVRFNCLLPEGLNIYKKHFFVNLISFLNSKYPKTLAYMKDDARSILQLFITSHPPSSPNLDEYGDNFPEFLLDFFQNSTSDENRSLPFELSTIDRMVYRSFNASSDGTIPDDQLMGIDSSRFDRLFLRLKATVHLERVTNLSYQIWSNRVDKLKSDIQYLANPDAYLLCFTKDITTEIIRLDKSGYVFLESLKQGNSLLASIELGLKVDPNFNLRNVLKLCFINKLFCSA
jgi:hypothetical protein